MLPATSIKDVLSQLDTIIGWAIKNNSRIGYFATLYRNMTQAVSKGIADNLFDDGVRMERLDVIFANRYLYAWECFKNRQPCSASWRAAFEACASNNLIVLQHLLLGINTHINLDLAIAAAETCPGESIYDLEKDFTKINDIIAVMSQQVQVTLSNIWFPLKALQQLSNKREEPVLNFLVLMRPARRVGQMVLPWLWCNGQSSTNT